MTYSCIRLHKVIGTRQILDLPQLNLPLGQITTIMGPNGAGKTTLLRILALLDLEYTGTLSLAGRPIERSAESAHRFHRRSAFIWQRPVMFNLSVAANVELGLRLRGVAPAKRTELVAQALSRLEIAHLANANAKRLSGGEMQKVSIARALVVEPELIFVDEPSANLDVDSIDLIHRVLLAERAAGKTIFLITHNFAEAQALADYVVFLNKGTVLAAGALSDLTTDKSLQESAYWRYL